MNSTESSMPPSDAEGSPVAHPVDAGQPSASEPTLDTAAQALFRLGRAFSRHPIHQVLSKRIGRSVEISHILVAQAVAEDQAKADHETTVGSIAERLAIDPSTASRLVAEAIHAGYLARTASATDGRRSHLVLTDAGSELVDHALRYQRSVFDQLTEAWPEQERLLFARLFTQFAQAVMDSYPSTK